VKAGDVLEIRIEQEESDEIYPQPIPIDVLFEDDAILVLNKLAGMIVHPTIGHYLNTLANGVVHYWKEKGERRRFRPIHRLDQDTSGAIAIAKTAHVQEVVSQQMHRDETRKLYLAIVHGVMPDDQGVIDGPIDRDPQDPHRRIVTPDGQHARTHYEVVERFTGATLVRLRLETGRTHQIRVHLTWLGFPLLGDAYYGNEASQSYVPMARQALHAELLGIYHPITNEWRTFEAPWPADLIDLYERLKGLE
jgi:23S rRNA pseudouridine1911/1915/1917 synthase